MRGVNINSRVAQRIIQYEVPRVVVDETNGELISGEISDSTPLKITLSPATDNINVRKMEDWRVLEIMEY